MAEAGPAGLLFIGDPHLSSRRPGRRRDADFVATCLGKLEQALAIAAVEDLVPVILGDLFDRPREDDHALITRALRLLLRSRHRVWCLVGNHDRLHAGLTDDTALGILREAGAVRTIEESGPAGILTLGGIAVGLGGTPHGQAIPSSVEGLFPDAALVVWVTHHDLAFGTGYPGAEPIPAIRGCAVAVNGHMHGCERPVTRGGTRWFNPGNILRRSVDLLNHVPAVWAWRPDVPDLLAERTLRFERDLFDLTGHLAPALDPEPLRSSLFVELLKAERTAEMERTSDASVLLEDIERLFAAEDLPEAARAVILDLHRQAAGGE